MFILRLEATKGKSSRQLPSTPQTNTHCRQCIDSDATKHAYGREKRDMVWRMQFWATSQPSTDNHGVVSQGKMESNYHRRHEMDATGHATHSHLQDRAARRTCRFAHLINVSADLAAVDGFLENIVILKRNFSNLELNKPTRSARRSVLKMAVCGVFCCVCFMSWMPIGFHFTLGNDAMIVA